MKASTAIILIVISGGLYYTFISPEYVKVQALQSEKAQYESILTNVADLVSKRDQLLVSYKAISPSDLDRLAKAIPSHIDTTHLALDLSTMAARYGISIKTIQAVEDKADNVPAPSGPDAGPVGGLQKVRVTLNFVASYDGFRKFVRDIESSLRIVDVKSLTFTQADNDLSQYSLALETYWLK